MSAIEIVRQHIPSLTEQDEQAIIEEFVGTISIDEVDLANLARRTCACGVKIDGFYEYVDHLEAELRKAGFD